MVHEKYITVNGKKYGPYYYESYRENGKVKKRYIKFNTPLGKLDKKRRVNIFLLLIPIFFLAVILAFLLLNPQISGRAVLDIHYSYVQGENISGIMKLSLKSGELLPINSRVIITQNGGTSEIPLSSLLDSNAQGSFYIENQNLQGEGGGYGFSGTRTIYPIVFFKLRVFEIGENITEEVEAGEAEGGMESIIPQESQPSSVSENITNQTQETQPTEGTLTEVNQTEEIQPTPEPTQESIQPQLPAEQPSQLPEQENKQEKQEAKEEKKEEKQTTPAEQPAEQPTPSPEIAITGASVKESMKEVDGQVSRGDDFTYGLEEGETANIKKNSVRLENNKKTGDNLIRLEISGQGARVSTDYSVAEEGFGQDFLGEESIVEIDLSKLNITAKTGTLTIKLVYENSTLAEASKEIIVSEENLTIEEQNITEENITIANETIANITLKTLNITTRQYKAVIGRPVKWIKSIRVENETEIRLELPKEAENITVKTGQEALDAVSEAENSGSLNLDRNLMTGNVALEIGSKDGFLTRLWHSLIRGLTGRVIEAIGEENIIETSDSKIVDLSSVSGKDIAVEYETPGPISNEASISGGKRIVISSAGEFNYTDILAYSFIDEKVRSENNQSIKLYHYIWRENKQETIENATVSTETAINETLVKNITEEIPANQTVNETQINVTTTPNESIQESNNEVSNSEGSVSEQSNTSAGITGSVIEEINDNIAETITEQPTQQNIAGYWEKEEVNFDAYDLDLDGVVDYIEWNVPHLSEQVYEIIIEISKAEHLDENYTFIEDVYEQVKSLDDNQTTIPDGHYVRVTFEQALDNTRDITIYARGNNSECYDNKTEILTENGWKYFAELNDNEKVMTLNANTGEKELQTPTEHQSFDNNGEMYNIETEEGNLSVSKEHKVYSKSMPNDLSFSTSSFVLNTSINDCCLKCISLDQIGIALESANAKYNVSSLSGIEEFACSRKDSNKFSGTNDILSFINPSNSSISSEDKELNFRILGLCSFISSSKCFGEYSFKPFKNKIFLVMPNPVNPVNTIPASMTSSIYFNEGYDFFNLSCIDLLTFLANSSASFSVNLDLETNSWNLSYPSVSSTLLANASLATSDQLITLNASIFFFNSSGTDIVKCSILNLSCVDKTQRTQQIHVYKSFGSENESSANTINEDKLIDNNYELANNPNSMEDGQLINVNLLDFSLNKITDVYSDFNSGKEVYFLNSENNPVKVKSIEKVPYSGKIYDVDVPNDIVLVKRGNSQAIWSGNSNLARVEVYRENGKNIVARFENIENESYYKIYLTNLGENESYSTFDLRSTGDVEYDYVVDPTIAENIVPNANLINVTAEGNFTHLNISTTAPYDGLVGYWNFDGDKENIKLTKHYDWTKNNYDGTGFADVTVNNTNCIYGDCANFDGNGDYVEIPSISSMNYVTISTWIKTTQTPADNAQIINRDGGYSGSTGRVWQFRMLAGGTFQVIPFDTGGNPGFATSTISINDGNWHHIASTWDGTTIRNYVDGVADGTGLLSGTLATDQTVILLGLATPAWTGGSYFLGLLDEVMIFNTALTSTQILAIYNNQSGRFANQGTQDIINQSYMNITAGNDRVNVTTYTESLLGSSINLSIGYYNTSWSYTNPQVVSSGVAQTFSISSTSTNLTLNYTFYAGNSPNPFYSPIIKENIIFTAWNVDTTPPAINFTYPTPANGTSQTGTSIYVNISSSDTNQHYIVNNFDNSLVGWWRGEGNAKSDTGINNGTLQGNANASSAGKFNSSFGFDGNGDYVEIPSISMNYVTISTWIKTTQTPADSAQLIQRDYADGRVWQFRMTPTGKLEFIPFNTAGVNGDAVSTISINDGNWHYIVSTWDGTTVRNYVDGVADGTGPLSGTLATYQKVIQVGAPNGEWTGGSYFLGSLDEIIIFNRSLSAIEILVLYNAGANKYYNNFTGLAVGTHTMTGYAVDSAGNKNQTETRSVTVDITPPVVNVTYPLNTTYNINISNLNYTIIEINPSRCWYSTNNGVVNSTSVNAGLNFTGITSTEGSNIWSVYCNDTTNNMNSSSVTFTKDTIYPQFSNLGFNYTNGSVYANGTVYTANATINNTNGTAGIQFNGVNYTATNVSSLFTSTLGQLSAGTYNYYWWAYGNGTSHLFNTSATYSYIVNKASSSLGLSATTPITYGTTTDFASYESGCPSGATCTLNITDGIFSVGTISANYSFAGNANYTGSSAVFTVTINKAVPNIISTVTSPINYGTISDFTCTGTNSGSSDLTYNLNQSNQIYGAGTVYVNCSTSGGANYTSNSTVKSLIISQANSQTSLTFDKTTPQDYGTAITPTCSLLTGVGITSLTNGTSGVAETLGAGSWNLNCSYDGNTNYTSSSNFSTFVINKNSTYVLAISGTTPITYGTITNAAGSGCPAQLTCLLDKSNIVYGVGTVTFNYSTSGNANYTANSITKDIIINQAPSSVYTYLNNSRDNLTINLGTSIWLNGSRIAGEGSIYLYNNETLINSDGSIGNYTLFSNVGMYNITTTYPSTQNYSSSSETWWVNVTPDTTYPIFSTYWDNNASLVGSGTAWFNVTVENTNGTVFLQINNINYTATNLSANMYNISINLGNGTYTYYWGSWGNGTSHLYNVSALRSYTVNASLGDTIPPKVFLQTPANNTLNISSNQPSFVFNATDETNATLDCFLWLRNSSGSNATYGRNSSTLNATSTTIIANLSLADGDYLWWINCSDGVNTNISETRNISINIENAIAISLSQNLSQQIFWNLASLPAINLSADGNNNELDSSFWINISTLGGTADLYMKASGDLMTDSLDRLGLGNETFSYNSTNSSVPSSTKTSLTTSYAKIGENLGVNSVVYLKFFLNAPVAQPAGTYNNTLLFKAIPSGQEP